MEFYRSEKINDAVTAIHSLTGEILYLIEGNRESVLIDTSIGIGHLDQFVRSLTQKPIKVLLTHGHIDHAMGAPDFQYVYMNKKDQSVYQRQCSLKERQGYLLTSLDHSENEWESDVFTISEPEKTFLSLVDGMCFDLGGIHIDVYEMPGHTQGSMIMLLREQRILILGDACNNSTFLFDKDASTVEEYLETVKKINKRLESKFDRVFLSYHVLETDIKILENMIQVCTDILTGNADDVPFEFMGMHAYIAKRCNEHFERDDGKSGNLIYSKHAVYKK